MEYFDMVPFPNEGERQVKTLGGIILGRSEVVLQLKITLVFLY